MSDDAGLLRQIIWKLESQLEGLHIEKAEMQLTGYLHAKKGYGIVELAENMGLQKSEWDVLKLDASILGLSGQEVQELDEHFGSD